MGIAIRHIVVNQNDEVLRLRSSFFVKLWEKFPGGILPQFARNRVRWAEVAVEMQKRQPVAIVRVVYCYLYFDAKGGLDTDRVMKDGALMIEAGIGNIVPQRSRSVIQASSRFAARRRDHEAIWKPNLDLKQAIYDAALGSKKYRRL